MTKIYYFVFWVFISLLFLVYVVSNMISQQLHFDHDFSSVNWDSFPLEFARFFKFSFKNPILSNVRTFVADFESSLNNKIIPRSQFQIFLESFCTFFNLNFNFPQFPVMINFFYFSFFFKF